MFLKETCNGSIKGWACSDGRKKRTGASKEYVTSPTLLLEAVLITSVIDAYEGKDVVVFNVPGYLLTADQYEVINMTLRGKLAELMVNTAPELYIKYVVVERGKMVLYVQLLNAFYV